MRPKNGKWKRKGRNTENHAFIIYRTFLIRSHSDPSPSICWRKELPPLLLVFVLWKFNLSFCIDAIMCYFVLVSSEGNKHILCGNMTTSERLRVLKTFKKLYTKNLVAVTVSQMEMNRYAVTFGEPCYFLKFFLSKQHNIYVFDLLGPL